MALIKDQLKKIGNPETGSTFDVIGENLGFMCGIRVWVEPDKTSTIIGIRFRVVQGYDQPTPLVFKENASKAFPDAKWAKAGTAHCSISASVQIPAPVWDSGQVLGYMEGNDIGGKVYDFLMLNLRPFEFQFDRPQFAEYFRKEVRGQLEDLNTPLDGASSAVVLEFGGQKVSLKDGFEVTPVAPAPISLSEGSGAGVGGDVGGVLMQPVEPLTKEQEQAMPTYQGTVLPKEPQTIPGNPPPAPQPIKPPSGLGKLAAKKDSLIYPGGEAPSQPDSDTAQAPAQGNVANPLQPSSLPKPIKPLGSLGKKS